MRRRGRSSSLLCSCFAFAGRERCRVAVLREVAWQVAIDML
jgi:hypothetical protein